MDEVSASVGQYRPDESAEQMQGDLEKYLHHYNHERPHQGRMMEGRTPAQTFEAGITEQPEETIPEAA